MQPDVVVVVARKGQLTAGFCQAVEDLLVDPFIPQASKSKADITIEQKLDRKITGGAQCRLARYPIVANELQHMRGLY